MSSGEYSSVSIADIVVNRAGRIRRDIPASRLEELASSISRLGLIHAPVITRELVLISGESRLEALKLLGWDRVTIQWSDSLDDKELLAMELEENVKRYALSWQEECDAIQRFHSLQFQLHTSWTATQTAEALGYSVGSISEKLQVAKALTSGNVRVSDAKEYSTAKNVVKRSAARLQADETALLNLVEDLPPPPASPFLNVDFNEWAPHYDGPPFNFIHCDFPYGINAETFNQSSGDQFGSYKDDFETYERLIQTLITNRTRLLGESGHILFWFSMRHYAYTLQELSNVFWTDTYPLIWHKSDNKGTLPDPRRGPRRVYEVAFLCSHGDRPIVAPVSNLFATPTVRLGEHMSEKSEDMLAYFMKMIVDENTRMLDPTCGSGSALRAARRLGASHLVGLERDPEFLENAERAWNAQPGLNL